MGRRRRRPCAQRSVVQTCQLRSPRGSHCRPPPLVLLGGVGPTRQRGIPILGPVHTGESRHTRGLGRPREKVGCSGAHSQRTPSSQTRDGGQRRTRGRRWRTGAWCERGSRRGGANTGYTGYTGYTGGRCAVGAHGLGRLQGALGGHFLAALPGHQLHSRAHAPLSCPCAPAPAPASRPDPVSAPGLRNSTAMRSLFSIWHARRGPH